MNITEKRKTEHISLCLNKNVSFRNKTTMFEDVSLNEVDLVYQALPELDKKSILTECSFLGKKFKAPFMASAITGGTKRAEKINKNIAKACQNLGIGMGLGSMRAMIENQKLSYTYNVRDVAPDIFLAGNIGVAQLSDFSKQEIENALASVGADALCIHINAAQEIIQPEGSHDFSGCIKQIGNISGSLRLPVIVKEVGHGISREIALELAKTNIAAIDIQGAGGTSWVGVDSYRSEKAKEIGKIFWDFGIPTAASLLEVKSAFKKPIIASGGIRNGLDAAKAIALGASLCGLALPVLKAEAKGGSKGVELLFSRLADELKVAMFMTSCKNISQLQEAKYVLKGPLLEWLKQRKIQ